MHTPYEDFEEWADRVQPWLTPLADLRKCVESNPPKAWLEAHRMLVAARSMEEQAARAGNAVNQGHARHLCECLEWLSGMAMAKFASPY